MPTHHAPPHHKRRHHTLYTPDERHPSALDTVHAEEAAAATLTHHLKDLHYHQTMHGASHHAHHSYHMERPTIHGHHTAPRYSPMDMPHDFHEPSVHDISYQEPAPVPHEYTVAHRPQPTLDTVSEDPRAYEGPATNPQLEQSKPLSADPVQKPKPKPAEP